MTDLDYFPPSLLKPEAKDDVLSWLAQLPLPVVAKKPILSLWSKTYNVQLTADDWKLATGEDLERSRY